MKPAAINQLRELHKLVLSKLEMKKYAQSQKLLLLILSGIELTLEQDEEPESAMELAQDRDNHGY